MHTTTQTPAWTTEQDAALDELLTAWVRNDDVRRTAGVTFEQLHDSLVALQEARRAVRDARRREAAPVLAA